VSAPVTAVIDGKLLARGAVRPAQARLEYSQADPWAVWARFRAGLPGDPAAVDFEWAFARDLLSAGLHIESGQGAVRVRPWALPSRRRVVIIEMLTTAGPVTFTTPAAGIKRFLKATTALVPPGTEARHLDLDAGIAGILAEGGTW
jgi:Streptomyces sporulation and cell division protein, SsgA